MKTSFVALAIVGILLILFGTVFALQGDGKIGGSAMSGDPFWIYAGSGVAIVGLVIAFLGFYLGSRKRPTAGIKTAGTPSKETSTDSPKP